MIIELAPEAKQDIVNSIPDLSFKEEQAMEQYEKPVLDLIEMNEAFLTDVTSCDTKMPEICISGDD